MDCESSGYKLLQLLFSKSSRWFTNHLGKWKQLSVLFKGGKLSHGEVKWAHASTDQPWLGSRKLTWVSPGSGVRSSNTKESQTLRRTLVHGQAKVLWKHQDLKPGLFSLRTLLLFLFLLLYTSYKALLSILLVIFYRLLLQLIAEVLSLQFVFNHTSQAVFT